MRTISELLFGTNTTLSPINAARPVALAIRAKRALFGGVYDATPRSVVSTSGLRNDLQDAAHNTNTALFGSYGR